MKLKNIIIVLLCMVLVLGVVGCNEKPSLYDNMSEEEKQQKANEIVVKYQLENNYKQFVEEYSLTAKDVQYDMANNLDLKFAVQGVAELSNYYNYGFDDSLREDYFVIKVRVNESDTDSWHLYCRRESFQEFLDYLKKNDKASLVAVCRVPSSIYKSSQGNQAILLEIVYDLS